MVHSGRFIKFLVVVVIVIGALAFLIGQTGNSAAAPGTVLFADDFNVPGRLPKSSSHAPQVAIGYVDGQYHIQKVDPAYKSSPTVIVPGTYLDAIITVTAHLVGETAGRGIFVTCRGQGGSTVEYSLDVYPEERRFRLYRDDGDSQTDLIGSRPSTAIRRGNEPNRIELACVGEQISASINGVPVAAVSDASYGRGSASIGLYSTDLLGDAWFDDLTIVAGDPAAPPVSIPPPSVGDPLLADNFDDPAQGFLARSSPNPDKWARGYEGGQYRIQKLDPSYTLLPASALPGTYGDTTLAVTTQVVGDSAGRYAALECRAQPDNQSLYRLVTSPGSQSIRLLRRDGDTVVDLVASQRSTAVKAGNEWNRVELTCAGSTITGTVNGERVASVVDATYPSGRLWIAGGATDTTADVRFDDLLVTLP